MATLPVLAPVAGTVIAVADVPDPVFSASLVGPGAAITPDPVFSAGLVGPGTALSPDPDAGGTAVAPVDGVVVKLHPHAFVVAADDGRAVLVHLGIDTVELHGDGFTLHVAEGDRVSAGQPVIGWDPAAVRDGGRSAVVPVVALDADAEELSGLAEVGAAVTAGDVLFTIA